MHMTSLQAAHPDVFGAWILDRRGVMISFRPSTPSVMGVQFSYRDYFRGAVSGDRPYVSPAFTAANPESSRAVGVSMAVRGVDGEVLGVVTVGYLLDGIDGYADRLSRVQGVELPWWTSRGSRSPAGVRMGG